MAEGQDWVTCRHSRWDTSPVMRVAVYTLHMPVAGEQAELHNSLAEELVVQESRIHVPSLDVGIGLEAVPAEGSSKRMGAEAEPEECSTESPDTFLGSSLGRFLGRDLVPPLSILPILHFDGGDDGGDDATFDCDRLQEMYRVTCQLRNCCGNGNEALHQI